MHQVDISKQSSTWAGKKNKQYFVEPTSDVLHQVQLTSTETHSWDDAESSPALSMPWTLMYHWTPSRPWQDAHSSLKELTSTSISPQPHTFNYWPLPPLKRFTNKVIKPITPPSRQGVHRHFNTNNPECQRMLCTDTELKTRNRRNRNAEWGRYSAISSNSLQRKVRTSRLQQLHVDRPSWPQWEAHKTEA